MYKLVLDKPGERPVAVYLEKDEAFLMARKNILTPGMLTIFNEKGKEIYRHAQPWIRQKQKVGAL